MWLTTVLRYYVIMLMVFLGLRCVVSRSFNAAEGPFELVIYNTSNCAAEQTWFKYNVTSYNKYGKSLLRGRVVVKRELKDVKFRIQTFYILGDRKVKVFDIKNQKCDSFIVHQVLEAIHIRFNSQKCSMMPDTAEFDNLNMDKIFHSVVRSFWYGTLHMRWQITKPGVQIMCLDIHFKLIEIGDTTN